MTTPRKKNMKHTLFSTCMQIGLWLLLTFQVGTASALPNFIVINTDDMNKADAAYMPSLQALLADQGTVFENAFVINALCCPSRSSFFRGQHVHNHGVLGQAPPYGGFDNFYGQNLEESTIATWLQGGGYRTGFFGKYMNGYPSSELETYVPPGWDDWNAFMQGPGFYGYQMNQNGNIVHFFDDPQDYSTDVVDGLVNTFINTYTTDNKPFFAYIAPHAPHGPSTPAPRHENAFPDVTLPKPPSYNEADVSDKPQWIQQLRPISASYEADLDALYRKRLQSLLAVDEMIGNIVTALDQHGILDNTYIIFTSDHGYFMGEHRFEGKGVPYEEAIRVPLIIRGPGVPVRSLTNFAIHIDIAPTIATLAGVRPPVFVDGMSLKNVLFADPPLPGNREERFIIEQLVAPLQNRERPAIPAWSALRTRNYLYVENETGEVELYDIVRDPYQLSNIAATSKQALLDQLSGWLLELSTCSGNSCRATR